MRHSLNRIPIPLLLAVAVAVGVAVTIVIQITILAPPPAVVAPIETPVTSLESGSATYTLSMDVPSDDYAVYPTLAGLGRLRLEANTTGWYYLQHDMIVTVVRRSSGDIVLTLSGNYRVYVREINVTHAFVFYDKYSTGIVAKKVQVGTTGWIVYHPVAVTYDTTIVNAIRDFLSSQGFANAYVFQPKRDYVTYDSDDKYFIVYFDKVDSNGVVDIKDYQVVNGTSFTPITTSVIVGGVERVGTYNYVLYPTWVLLYYRPSSSVRTAFTITPT
jgi:hypothetical protein